MTTQCGRAFVTPFHLFSENFLHVADFSLYLARHFLRSPAIPQIRVSNRFASLFFHFAHSFLCGAFNFIVCA